ncbi:MAG: glucosaminidase domain-containing protein [Chitinophagaceae bacterium]|nr:glucosaminidase domain-containing protein [Chitinophagaceae bacterium]MCW5904637.1 glucosaminidase domain-containing protein [Chitinophagaceae bacterium]
MKQIVLITTFLYASIHVFAQSEKAANYVQLYKDAAITEMKRGGVPAAIILAQGMLESAYGESELCKKSNNHFGIKCKNDWEGEKTYHDDDEKGECFRVYTSAAESFKDHTNFLKSRSWYAFLFKLSPTDYAGWAKGLKKAGYATERDYADKLIKLIVDNDLQQYTLAGLNENELANNTEEIEETDTTIQADTVSNKTDVEYHEEKKDTVAESNTQEDTTVINNNPVVVVDTTIDKKTLYTPDSIFTINHAKVIYVLEGTSFLSLANKYKISLSTLYAYNDIQPLDIVDKDRLIFLERKLKKGAVDLYTAEGGETLYLVSQTQGVQLESLLQYNKHLKKDSQLLKGDKVYLRHANK